MTILSVAEVAARLRCTEETVREHTPHDLPGVKFGRDWIYVEADVVAAVSRLALKIQKANALGTIPAIVSTQVKRRRGKPLPEPGGQISVSERGMPAHSRVSLSPFRAGPQR